LLDTGKTTRVKVAEALEEALGKKPAEFLDSNALEDEIGALKDRILAIKVSPADHHLPILRLASVLRAHALVQRFVDDAAFPADTDALRVAQQRGMWLPDAVLPTRAPPPERAKPPGVADRLKGMAARHDRLTAAIDELRRIRPGGFASVVQRERPAVLPPEKFRPLHLFEQEFAIRRQWRAKANATSIATSIATACRRWRLSPSRPCPCTRHAPATVRSSTTCQNSPRIPTGRGR
jgi:hypothetical protein